MEALFLVSGFFSEFEICRCRRSGPWKRCSRRRGNLRGKLFPGARAHPALGDNVFVPHRPFGGQVELFGFVGGLKLFPMQVVDGGVTGPGITQVKGAPFRVGRPEESDAELFRSAVAASNRVATTSFPGRQRSESFEPERIGRWARRFSVIGRALGAPKHRKVKIRKANIENASGSV
ncbi:MAG: hypothetical protein QOH88_944 [Verrucomicrobiota bacterium]